MPESMDQVRTSHVNCYERLGLPDCEAFAHGTGVSIDCHNPHRPDLVLSCEPHEPACLLDFDLNKRVDPR